MNNTVASIAQIGRAQKAIQPHDRESFLHLMWMSPASGLTGRLVNAFVVFSAFTTYLVGYVTLGHTEAVEKKSPKREERGEDAFSEADTSTVSRICKLFWGP